MAPRRSRPRTLGRYALYDRIASGGMASVHLGRLVGPVGFARTVAIKRMHPHVAEDAEFAAMFLDEARLAARIRHPNVVPTLDVVAEGGELFLVMEFVQGESLATLIRAAGARGERVPPAIAATIMAGVLHGLHAAHEATNDAGEPLDVVHRDVSPQNVLVGVDGVARVLDFGVAKAAGRLQTTREGEIKGKLAYMAPEQLRGVMTRVTDVYAASVVLWEALTGDRLFDGDNDGELYAQLMAGCDEPPSRWAPDISPALDAVVMRGLAIDPALRFATAREMAWALEEAVAVLPASKVGAWVERTAGESLAKRSARVARIERGASAGGAPDALDGEDLEDASRPAGGPDSHGGHSEQPLLTPFSSGSMTSPHRPLLGPRSRMATLAALGATFLLGTAVVCVRIVRPPSPPPIIAAGSRAPAPPAPPVALEEGPVASAAGPSSAWVDVPPVAPRAASSAITRSSPPPRRPPRASVARPAVTAPAAAPTPASASPSEPVPAASCDPPYTLNELGHHVRKPECR